MWQLIINGPGYFDTTYDLPEGETSLGRADENDIVLSGDLVSRKHARIRVNGDQIGIEDLGSRNGSRLNGLPLTGTVTLKAGDIVHVGENSLSIRQPAKVETATTEVVDLGAGGVKRFGEGADIASAVVIARNVRESVVLKALDNVMPFQPFAGMEELTPEPVGPPPIAYESLLLLYKTAEALTSARSLQEFLEQTTDRVLNRVNATTAVVLLRHHSGVMVPAVVRHRGKLEKGEVPVSDAIIHEAFTKGAALVVADVREDRRFASRESVLMYGIDQVLCIPIGEREPFAGVLYLNKKAEDQTLLEQLLDLCTAVAHLIGTGVAKFSASDRDQEQERLRRALERFHAPDIVEKRVGELSRPGSSPFRLEERNATLLFVDLVGLPALAKSGPDSLVDMLNEFHRRVTAGVFSFEGTLDTVTGDSAMACFGAPYSRGDDALRAVRAALTLKADWDKAMQKRPAQHRCSLRIGLTTGKVLAGTVGSEGRVDHATLGESVDVVSWLCASGQPGQILITGKTLAAIGARFDVNPLGERTLGPRDRMAVFEVLEEDVSGQFTNPGAGLR
ncbi:MAG TPA: adenylate/guanylate cyclase domain-containing protein [Longimicrobium sp.]|nr:adenylate/guanylate cyclase domain-containing protein [Longimicrobium sp.]